LFLAGLPFLPGFFYASNSDWKGGALLKTVAVEEAEGMVLCHDLTQIVPGEFKGPAFRKGHIVRKEDIPRLRDMGKENLYVWDLSQGLVHEDEAALRIAAAVAGPGIRLSGPREGKMELFTACSGLLKVNVSGLLEVNRVTGVMLACLHNNQPVPVDRLVGGTRIIPLVIEEEKLQEVLAICQQYPPLLQVKPFTRNKVGMITTGSEVYYGRIKDGFGPVIAAKVEQTGSTLLGQLFVPDSLEMIVSAIHQWLEEGAEIITITGGMSVDPDDLTPAGIRAAGGEVITYGAPVLPGAMFMLAYINDVPIMGIPGCAMYHQTSIFDLIFPRLLAGERVTHEEIIQLAHGGLCAGCQTCRYPDCSFGKGC